MKKLFITLSLLSTSILVPSATGCYNQSQTKPDKPVEPEKSSEPKDEIKLPYVNDPISKEKLQVNSTSLNLTLKQNADSLYYSFFNDIVESAQNDIPSVFINRNAAQVFISGLISIISQLELSKNLDYKYNDNLYLVDASVWNYAERSQKNNRFDFNTLLTQYGDIVKENKEVDIDKGRILILEDTKYISDQENPYNVFPRSLNELLLYLKPYLDAGVQLFDFFIPDISFIGMQDELRNWIIKHANKITILSDGNAQPYKFIRDNYISWSKNQKTHYTREELLKYWNEFKTSEGLDLKINYHFFYGLDDKIKIYNLNKNYIIEMNDKFDENNMSWAKLNINAYPLNPKTIYEYLDLPDSIINDTYLKVNNLYERSFLDFIIEGSQNYDSNKKNLIFMGSSLFRKTEDGQWRFETQKYALDEIHELFAKIQELYPKSEYNYFFKLHPVYNLEDSKTYLKYLLGENARDAILLNSGIAWENMLVVDYENIKNNKSILFDEQGNSKTQLYGIQGTTTVLLSTMTFLRESFNWDNDKVKSFVDIQNFPLSNTFNIVKRDIEYKDPDKAFEANQQEMRNVYYYFTYSKDFPTSKEWIDMRQFLKRTK
ncbi:hypothetical protein C4M96_01890 [Mycoplasmopsis pullorum]|uniref:hypothetical protein n=1 Tax=Mycoplasmopsis pullorum TaxID=48003 RepID=UPI00111A51D4|nr:hypothetical protein [Mycoplasmopsis pullorum]TNK92140.1 hypothetical protein C4M96_01890 [Mycoplasmopsis pullorum]